ncbi:succinate--hydroxymethylglutarate CoA-transferase isoform X3 [Loxodonta africana]|uniref:succinate--hydroxymethylglutarate CoA-transferase isoform X3 n=1 Tax=Loxodonta africana TaxID=9785 RepID=UPI0030CF6AA4
MDARNTKSGLICLPKTDGDPVHPGVARTDLATGLYAYGAIMAGLIQRYKTGKGLFVECNLLSSQAKALGDMALRDSGALDFAVVMPQVACLTQVAANYLIGQKGAQRWGAAHGSIVPHQEKIGPYMAASVQVSCSVYFSEMVQG